LTTKHDVNDTIIYYGDDPDYHSDGTYYIRLRPDFALYDLISKREYIFKMYTFSMTPAAYDAPRGFETLELGREYLGFANNSRYQDYRYFQMDISDAEYDIGLTRFPEMGRPIFYVSIMDSVASRPARANDKHFKSQPLTANGGVQSLKLTSEEIKARQPRCDGFFTSLQGNGAQRCFISIAVRCAGSSFCAWKLVIEQKGVLSTKVQSASAGLAFDAVPPGPILEGEYTNGQVYQGQVKYYFFPIEYETMGDPLILLNKTQIYSTGANGDTKLLVNM
jgi:hypothetical protein